MGKVVEVEVRNVYGKTLVYPVTFSKELEQLTGKKTLSEKDVESLKVLGLEVVPCQVTLAQMLKKAYN